MPLISVVIPAYNAEKTILETIASVEQQTFQDWEIIVIDDGSTDATLAKINQLQHESQDQRLQVFSYPNGGVAVARDRGIMHARGEYIAFLDADDCWTKDKLEKQLAALQAFPEAGVAYSWTSYFQDEAEIKIYPGDPVYYTGDVYQQLLLGNFLASGSNPLIKKAAIDSVEGFDSACVPCEDWDFYLQLAAKWNFVLVPQHQIIYRLTANSGSSKLQAVEKAGIATINKAYQGTSSQLQGLKKHSLAWFYQYCTQQHLQHTPGMQGLQQAGNRLWQAIRLHPPILFHKYTSTLLAWWFKKWLRTQFSSI